MRHYDRPFVVSAICLAAIAGCVDALGFLSLGGFFVSFMSGNTTRLGVASGSGALPDAIRAASLIVTFVLGVMGGTMIAHAFPHRRKPAVLAAVTVLLAIAASCHGQKLDQLALFVTAAAMGTENGIFQRNGEVTIGLTYMTGTLVRFAQRAALALVGGERWAWLPHLLLWLGFLGGVLAGTRAYRLMGLDTLWVAVVATALMTLVLARLGREA